MSCLYAEILRAASMPSEPALCDCGSSVTPVGHTWLISPQDINERLCRLKTYKEIRAEAGLKPGGKITKLGK
jgi:hypothetical protein